MINTPVKSINEISNVIQKCVWNVSTSKISQKILIQDISKSGLKLCDFKSKVNALKLSWVKRLCLNSNANWTILQFYNQHFYSCNNLDIIFRGNQPLKSNIHIPKFYSDIHEVYINNFMKKPFNSLQILKQPLWFNSHISSNSDIMYITKWSIKGINQIKDIIDKNGNVLSHEQLTEKYDITPFLTTLQLFTSIPKRWKTKLKTFTININCILVGNSINVNNKVLNIEKIKCKDYWHLINKASHIPNNIFKWCETYPDFKNADPKTGYRIFKLPFQVIRENRIQNFQYKILQIDIV